MKAKSLLAIALAFAASAALSTDFVWTGASTAVDKTWADAANWTVNGEATDTWPKTAEDTATFNTECVPVRNEDATVGEIILNADVTLRFGKWLTVGKVSGSGKLILMNRARLRNINGTSVAVDNEINIVSPDGTDCSDHARMPYIQGNGANFTIRKLTGDGSAFLTMSGYYGVCLEGDTTEFTGTIHIDQNNSNRMKFSGEGGGPRYGRVIVHGTASDNGATTFNGGTIYFGSLYTEKYNEGFNFVSNKGGSSFNTYIIGGLNRDDDRLTLGMGDAANGGNPARARIVKEGTGTLELGPTRHLNGTIISNGTLRVTHANGIAYNNSDVVFAGGKLVYGSHDDVVVTKDISSCIKNSTSPISIDTDGKDISFGSSIASSNIGGLTKDGEGKLTLGYRQKPLIPLTVNEGTLEMQLDSSGTIKADDITDENNRITVAEGATLHFTRYNKAQAGMAAPLYGSGTVKIDAYGGQIFRVNDGTTFANFTGTFEVTGVNSDTSMSGFQSRAANLENTTFVFSATPTESTRAIRFESGDRTIGALQLLGDNAYIDMGSNLSMLTFGGKAGSESIINGQIKNGKSGSRTLKKTGSTPLTLGPNFSMDSGWKLRVDEGSLNLQNPDLSGGEVLVRRGVTVTGKAMFGTGTLKYYDETGNTLLATYDGTTITTTTANDETSAAAVCDMISGTVAEEGQDVSAFKMTMTSNGDGTWSVASALDEAEVKVEPADAAPAVADGNVEFTIPAANVKKGLYYAVSTSSDNANWTAGEYEKAGESEVSLTAEMPASGVKYYRISVKDSAQAN